MKKRKIQNSNLVNFALWLCVFSFTLLASFEPSARIYIPVDQPSDKMFPIAVTKLVAQEGVRDSAEIIERIPSIIKNDLILSGYF